VAEWSPISASRMAIGQGVAVTALQMASIYSAIANDGVMMRPYLVRKVVATDGTVLHERRPEEIGSPITVRTAKVMQRLLARVTEKDGTGKRAHVDGYAVAGKTGTAQKPIPGGYSSTDHIASFVGFLPADSPRISIVVVVDEPQPIHTGGLVAAPVFQAIASEAARYLDLPATETPAMAKR
jgi:cell division protein FtsI (penicillin-binding protein 3)